MIGFGLTKGNHLNNSENLKEAFLALLSQAEPITIEEDEATEDKPREGEATEDAGGVVGKLLPLVQNDPLFQADDGASYIFRSGRLVLLDGKNRELCEDLRLEGYEKLGKTPSRETVSTVIDLLSARARREGEPVELFNRIAEKDGCLFYDMADGTAIKVAPGSWETIPAPVVFRQMRHQKAQVAPAETGGDVWRFLDFFEIQEEQQLLLLITMIAAFVPRISHPAIHVSGCQGSGKSVLTALFKKIVDPSSVILSVMPRKPEDLDLLFYRYKVLVLDNLSALNADTCDRLCSLISGGTIEKRTLHTDLDTTVFKCNPLILFSSIGSLHSRPDLAERTIVIELQRIPEEKRMVEEEFLLKFAESLPVILGGIFDVLARALEIIPTVTLPKVPRMAGFAKWGFALAEALNNAGEEFLIAYEKNSRIQTGELLERDSFFAAIVEAMEQPGRNSLSGSFHEVLMALMEVAAPGEAKNGYAVLQKDKTFPTARGFRKHLERIRIPLEGMGISFKIDNRRTAQAKAFVTLTKHKPTESGQSVPF